MQDRDKKIVIQYLQQKQRTEPTQQTSTINNLAAKQELLLWNNSYEEQLKAFFDYSDQMVKDRRNDLLKIAN